MSTDFWAGWASGLTGIVIGNPLDIVKVRLQAGQEATRESLLPSSAGQQGLTSLIRGVAAPALAYGALNAVLYVTYNRALFALDSTVVDPTNIPHTSLSKVWVAGAAGGLAIWTLSAPSELIKCRVQLSDGKSSWSIARGVYQRNGIRGLFHGGAVTSIRDSVGYGFYFWAYEWSKRSLRYQTDQEWAGSKILFAGGIAGVITWASVFPLDVIKTRQQGLEFPEARESHSPGQPLLQNRRQVGAIGIARQIYRHEGIKGFFHGLGVCSIRAFVVNAVQWATYEWVMTVLK